MPRPRNRELKHCRHRASGRGYVRIGDVFHYTGRWGSREAEERYKILNGEHLARGGVAAPAAHAVPAAPAVGVTVGEIADLYVARHVLSCYRRPDGLETPEVRNIAAALRPLRTVWGSTSAAEFSPLRLEQLREALAQGRHRKPGERGTGGLARTRINRDVQRIKQLFAWAVRSELVRPSPARCQ